MEDMTQINDGVGAISVDETTMEALQALGVALDASRMTARIRLTARDGTTVSLVLGRDSKGRSHSLRARPVTGPASHLGIYDIEGY